MATTARSRGSTAIRRDLPHGDGGFTAGAGGGAGAMAGGAAGAVSAGRKAATSCGFDSAAIAAAASFACTVSGKESIIDWYATR